MSEFIYKDYSCALSFGENKFELPLNEQTAQKIDSVFNDEIINRKLETIEAIDRLYDDVMDGIDELLGDGAADKIMSRFAHPGTMEILSVVRYIVTEWKAQYKQLVDEMKQTTPATNRAGRRAKK